MDISDEAVKAFGQTIQNLSGEVVITNDLVGRLNSVFKEAGDATNELIASTGRLTDKGFDELLKNVDKAGKDYLRGMKSIQQDTDKIFGRLNNAFGDFAKRIPVIGNSLEKGFSTMLASLTTRTDALLAKTWGRMGAGSRAGAGMGIAAIASAGALLLKTFNDIEKVSVSISKQTGLTGKNLQFVRKNMIEAQNASIRFGVSMEESAEAAAGLVTSLGNFRKISPELIKTTSLIAKYTGLGAEEAAKFTGTMVKGFGMTAKDVETFSDRIVDFATRSGVNARKVMSDIASDTNLTSIYLSRGEDYLKRAAIQAQKMGKSMGEIDSVSQGFLDLDSAAESVGLLNQYTGSSLNALEMFNLAARKDTTAIMSRLNQAFSTPQGIRFVEDMPGLAEKFAGQFNLTLRDVRVMAGLEKSITQDMTFQEKKAASIAESVAAQQTTFSRITNELKQDIFPIVNTLGEKLVKVVNSIGVGNIAGLAATAAALATIGIGGLLMRGTDAMPMVTRESGLGGGLGDRFRDRFRDSKRKTARGTLRDRFEDKLRDDKGKTTRGTLRDRFRDRFEDRFEDSKRKTARGTLRDRFEDRFIDRLRDDKGKTARDGLRDDKVKTARGALRTGLRGSRAAGSIGTAAGLGILGKGVGKAALRAIPGLGALFGIYEAYNYAKQGKYMAAALSAGAGLAGIIPGIGTKASLALSVAGQTGAAFAGAAATGRVVSSPNLFMVGEENRKEVIVPTERIRKGMPVNSDVARELGSIGVPGFAGGRGGALQAQYQSARNTAQAQAQARVVSGAQSDPAAIRAREVKFQQQAQRERDEQRRMMREIEDKSLQILEEERRIATNIANPTSRFAGALSLWEKIREKAEQKAREYAGKTRDRFLENLRENNGDLRAAMEATWQQTLGDLENLQAKLYGKLEQWVGKLADKALDKAKEWGSSALDWVGDKLGINNKANRQQFENGIKELANTTTQAFSEKFSVTATDQGRIDAEVRADALKPLDAEAQDDALKSGVGGEKPELGGNGVVNFFKGVGSKAGEIIGDAVYSARNAFSTGREFSHVSKDLGDMGSSTFTEGMNFAEKGIFKLGQAFGDIEKALGPVGKSMGTLSKSIDGTSVAMLASGDVAAAVTYTAKKEGISRLTNMGAGAALKGTKLEGAAGSLAAGAGQLAQGDLKGAGLSIGKELARKGIAKGAGALAAKAGAGTKLAGAIGGGVAAGAIGAVDGLMAGDMKAAGKGALSGAVGYAMGAALTPVLGPLGPVVGSILAGPATEGIITGGKEVGKGAKNMAAGVGKIFQGDFKGGLKGIGKGALQLVTSPVKALGAFAKGIGGLFGFGKKKPKDGRRKVLQILAENVRTGGPMFARGGKLSKNKKLQENLALGIGLGKNGPDKNKMALMMNQIMKAFGLSPEIAQAVIYAALGAIDKEEDLAKIDQELGLGWESVLKDGSWQKAFNASGSLKGTGENWRSIGNAARNDTSEAMNLLDSQAEQERGAAAQRANENITNRAAQAAQLAAGGFTIDELMQIGLADVGEDRSGNLTMEMNQLNRAQLANGSGVFQGNVYLDGVKVGTLANDAASAAQADGLPVNGDRNKLNY